MLELLEYKIHFYLAGFIIFAALELALSVFNVSIMDYFMPLKKPVYILAGISAFLFAIKRDNWLPFLGQTVFPHNILQDQEPEDATEELQISTSIPNAKIVYWASKDTQNETTPVFDAYDDFSNAGITTTNEKGEAILKIRKSTGYIVPSGKYIKRHVHYRIGKGKHSMLGRVRTYFY